MQGSAKVADETSDSKSVSAGLSFASGGPLLENNLVLVGLGAVIFILIFVVCCMLMKMRRNTTRGKSFEEETGSGRFGSEMKNIYGADNDAGDEIRRPSEMALAANASDRHADDRAERDGVHVNNGMAQK